MSAIPVGSTLSPRCVRAMADRRRCFRSSVRTRDGRRTCPCRWWRNTRWRWYCALESGGVPDETENADMTTMRTEVPDAIYKQAVAMAEREKVPVERLLSLALAQAMGAWQTESIIAERAKRGNREKFLAVLSKAPDVPPMPGDELPAT